MDIFLRIVIFIVAGPKAMVLASAIGAGAMTLLQFGVKPFQAKR